MKPVIIIAIAFVLLSGTIVTVTGEKSCQELWDGVVDARKNDNSWIEIGAEEREILLSDVRYEEFVNSGCIDGEYEVSPPPSLEDCKKLEKAYDDQREAYLRADWQGKMMLEALMEKLVDNAEECYKKLDAKQESISNLDIICGKGTMEKNGQCVPTQKLQTKPSLGGGCLIATATYGSELASQVQQLRELRDNQILSTESGVSFMNTFNDFYYSFSPYIADYERENPVFKELVKITITPMVTSLSLMEYADSESKVLGIGISLIILNGLMYVGIPVLAVMRFRK
jgi:hypothetical protein